MKKVLVFILMLFVPFFIDAEEINLNWFNNFGGTEDDFIDDLIEVDDGFFALGTTNIDASEYANQDIWLIKYDFNGKELWSKKFGGSDWDGAPGLMLTTDNNLVIYYSSWSIDIDKITNKGMRDFVVIKLDLDGNIVGFSARIYRGEKDVSKYMNSRESKLFKKGETLYNYHNAKDFAKREKRRSFKRKGAKAG